MSLAADYINDMRPQDILMPVPAGLCCKPGGFHIDPVRPVERAVIMARGEQVSAHDIVPRHLRASLPAAGRPAAEPAAEAVAKKPVAKAKAKPAKSGRK